MPAPKGNTYAKGNGRPSKYDSNYHDKLVFKLCLLGATDKQIADIFEISEVTLNAWKNTQSSFLKSLKKGKEEADSKVAKSLFQRATGYEHEEDKLFQYDGNILSERITKHYPPDVVACIFWLKNRQPELWRDKTEIETSNKKTINVIVGDKKTQKNLESLYNEN